MEAALAARRSRQILEMRDLLHTKYNDWVKLTVNQFNSWIKSQVISIGLDAAKFVSDYQSSETAHAQNPWKTRRFNSAFQIVAFINGSLQPAAILDYNS